MTTNRIMLSDSYKYSHPSQYPSNMVKMFDYMEARSSKIYPKTVWVGLQGLLKTYFAKPITMEEVDEAMQYAEQHGIPFDYEGWAYIAIDLKGKLPVRIHAVPEGSIIPNGNVLMTIESTNEKVPWVVGWMETVLMKLWYPCTVATKSYYVKQILLKYDNETQESSDVDFQFHNFGDRGSTSVEAASIGGMAHLSVGFKGTDNFNSLKYINENYGPCTFPAFSIPATEHSTVTSWSQENEFEMIDAYLESNKDKPIIACVLDSYDIFTAVNTITSGNFKQKIESDDYPIFVIRPDSGDPIPILHAIINIMEDNFVLFSINNKGYKVWNKYRIIWGDGITPEQIEKILNYVTNRGYSSECIAFGSGGDLMQNLTRDTLGFAIKCSSIDLWESGHWGSAIYSRNVFKDPITDPGKTSKKGKVSLYYDKSEKDYFTTVTAYAPELTTKEVLETIYENGKLIKEYTFDEIRERSAECY